jgi:hypothetical protein
VNPREFFQTSLVLISLVIRSRSLTKERFVGAERQELAKRAVVMKDWHFKSYAINPKTPSLFNSTPRSQLFTSTEILNYMIYNYWKNQYKLLRKQLYKPRTFAIRKSKSKSKETIDPPESSHRQKSVWSLSRRHTTRCRYPKRTHAQESVDDLDLVSRGSMICKD